MLKLSPKFAKNKFSNLVMGKESWIQLLEFHRTDSNKIWATKSTKDLVLTDEQCACGRLCMPSINNL